MTPEERRQAAVDRHVQRCQLKLTQTPSHTRIAPAAKAFVKKPTTRANVLESVVVSATEQSTLAHPARRSPEDVETAVSPTHAEARRRAAPLTPTAISGIPAPRAALCRLSGRPAPSVLPRGWWIAKKLHETRHEWADTSLIPPLGNIHGEDEEDEEDAGVDNNEDGGLGDLDQRPVKEELTMRSLADIMRRHIESMKAKAEEDEEPYEDNDEEEANEEVEDANQGWDDGSMASKTRAFDQLVARVRADAKAEARAQVAAADTGCCTGEGLDSTRAKVVMTLTKIQQFSSSPMATATVTREHFDQSKDGLLLVMHKLRHATSAAINTAEEPVGLVSPVSPVSPVIDIPERPKLMEIQRRPFDAHDNADAKTRGRGKFAMVTPTISTPTSTLWPPTVAQQKLELPLQPRLSVRTSCDSRTLRQKHVEESCDDGSTEDKNSHMMWPFSVRWKIHPILLSRLHSFSIRSRRRKLSEALKQKHAENESTKIQVHASSPTVDKPVMNVFEYARRIGETASDPATLRVVNHIRKLEEAHILGKMVPTHRSLDDLYHDLGAVSCGVKQQLLKLSENLRWISSFSWPWLRAPPNRPQHRQNRNPAEEDMPPLVHTRALLLDLRTTTDAQQQLWTRRLEAKVTTELRQLDESNSHHHHNQHGRHHHEQRCGSRVPQPSGKLPHDVDGTGKLCLGTCLQAAPCHV